jgi:hypothetical protein
MPAFHPFRLWWPYFHIALSLIALLAGSAAAAQQNPPMITFTLDFPNSSPEHYVIRMSEDGQASYASSEKATTESPADPFHLDFTLPATTTREIFDLARKANYFQGKVDSGKTKIASTGAKTLTYQDGQLDTRAEYNFSLNSAVQQITEKLQDLSQTLEFGRRLDYERRYQKLALDDELKRMETMYSHKADALTPLAGILKEIATDQSLITPVRSRAQRLLAASGASQ